MASGRQNALFIGYRRDDTQDTAGRIYDRLVRAFGEKAVFKDVDNLPIGSDFGAHILGLLPRCRVFLALIGPDWLDAKDETGHRRLDDAGDWVRIELETAFATPGLQVVPVLVNGARMPRAEELPESLRRLTRLNAASVRRDPDFSADMTRMVEALRANVQSGVLDLASLGGERNAVSTAHAGVGGGNVAGWMAPSAIAMTALIAIFLWQPWRILASPASSPANNVTMTTPSHGASGPAQRTPDVNGAMTPAGITEQAFLGAWVGSYNFSPGEPLSCSTADPPQLSLLVRSDHTLHWAYPSSIGRSGDVAWIVDGRSVTFHADDVSWVAHDVTNDRVSGFHYDPGGGSGNFLLCRRR